MVTGLLAVLLLFSGQTLRLEPFVLDAAEGYSLETRLGPDFAIHYVHPTDDASSQLGVYLGDHPRSFASGRHTRGESFRLGRKKVVWTLWESTEAGKPQFHAEVLVEKPFGSEQVNFTRVHLFIVAGSREARAALQQLCSRIRLASPRDRQ